MDYDGFMARTRDSFNLTNEWLRRNPSSTHNRGSSRSDTNRDSRPQSRAGFTARTRDSFNLTNEWLRRNPSSADGNNDTNCDTEPQTRTLTIRSRPPLVRTNSIHMADGEADITSSPIEHDENEARGRTRTRGPPSVLSTPDQVSYPELPEMTESPKEESSDEESPEPAQIPPMGSHELYPILETNLLVVRKIKAKLAMTSAHLRTSVKLEASHMAFVFLSDSRRTLDLVTKTLLELERADSWDVRDEDMIQDLNAILVSGWVHLKRVFLLIKPDGPSFAWKNYWTEEVRKKLTEESQTFIQRVVDFYNAHEKTGSDGSAVTAEQDHANTDSSEQQHNRDSEQQHNRDCEQRHNRAEKPPVVFHKRCEVAYFFVNDPATWINGEPDAE